MRSAPHAAVLSDDAELVRRALTRDDTAFRTIMERHNRDFTGSPAASCEMTAKPKMPSRKRMSTLLPIWAVFAAIPLLRHGFPASP